MKIVWSILIGLLVAPFFIAYIGLLVFLFGRLFKKWGILP